jgi:hypothetical protein
VCSKSNKERGGGEGDRERGEVIDIGKESEIMRERERERES